MALSDFERRILSAVAGGLPLTARPYAALAASLGCDEAAVVSTLKKLVSAGRVKRLGLVVHHHALGYRANAMVVWPLGDRGPAAAAVLSKLPFVTLCYRRRPQPPAWSYDLYVMIHGRDRATVLAQIEQATVAAGLVDVPRQILFSLRRFKQCGAAIALPGAA